MSSGQDLRRHQQGIVQRYYEHRDTIMLEKLGQIVGDLYLAADADKRQRLWDSAAKALTQLQVPPARIQHVCGSGKPELLAALVTELTGAGKSAAPSTTRQGGANAGTSLPAGAPPASASAPARAAGVTPAAITPDTLKSALKAFRKRLKLTRLDDESQLGSHRNPLSSGTRSNVVAIQPPAQFPPVVWEELVKQGKLRSAGRGFYQLAEGM